MKKFILYICSFLSCFFIVILMIVLVVPYGDLAFFQGYKSKIKLLEKMEPNRIILVGGSSVAFGFDSHLIQDSLKMNVINYGLHAGIGMKFMLDDVEYYAQKGDVIVLASEYSHFFRDVDEFKLAATDLILGVANQKVNLLSFNQKIGLIKNSSGHIKSKLLSNTMKLCFPAKYYHEVSLSVYASDSFNDRGDVVKHWGKQNRSVENSEMKKDSKINNTAIDYLINKINVLKEKGCLVYMLPCTVNTSSYNNSYKPYINQLSKRLKHEKIEYISDPKNHVFADSLYYDSPMHLNKQGATMRSLELINNLKAKLALEK